MGLTPESNIRILSWNLWHGLNPYERYRMSPMQGRKVHSARYARQLELLAQWCKYPGGILCVQEVNPLARRFDELSAGLGREGGACLVNAGVKLGGIGLPVGLQEGLATFAGESLSGAVFEQCTLSGSAFELQTPEGSPFLTFQTQERRKALLVEGWQDGRKIAVVNLHLHHGPDSGEANLARKKAELERLREWLEPKMQSWDLAAICGDFNCDPGSACLEPLGAMGFKDSAQLAGLIQGPTWSPQENPFARESARLADTPETAAWDGAPHAFDRIYLRSRFPVHVRGHHLWREPTLSDHFGVWVDLAF